MKVNLGCRGGYFDGWTNVDADAGVRADIHLDPLDFLRRYADDIDTLYVGALLEQHPVEYALSLLRLANDRLRPGTLVVAVTHDVKAILRAAVTGALPAAESAAADVSRYVEQPENVSYYDTHSLAALFHRAGFADVTPIGDLDAELSALGAGPVDARWRCAVRGVAVGRRYRSVDAIVEAVTEDTAGETAREAAEPAAEETAGVSRAGVSRAAGGADAGRPLRPEVLTEAHSALHEVQKLRSALIREHERRVLAEQYLEELTERTREDTARRDEPVERVPEVGGREPDTAAAENAAALTWRERAKRFAKTVLPPGSRGRIAALGALHLYRESRTVLRSLRRVAAEAGFARPPSYPRWYRYHDATPHHLRLQRRASERATMPPTFLVCVLADTADRQPIATTIASIRSQSWQHAKLVICAAEPIARALQEVFSDVDVVGAPTIADAVMRAVDGSDRDFVLLPDAGDVLAADCLYRVAQAAWRNPLLDLIYWDDDQLGADGRRHDPLFRPSWSPEMLFSVNYLGQSFAIRRRRIRAIGPLHGDSAEVMRWDLLLRGNFTGEQVERLAHVLGHVRRRVFGVTEAGRQVVQAELARRGLPAAAELDAHGVRLRWQLPEWPTVSIIIPTRHNRRLLSTVLDGLRATDYPSFEVRIVDNGGYSTENEAWYAEQLRGLDAHVTWWTEEPFNYSRVNNAGAADARGDVLVFLNDDIELTDPSWLRELVGWTSVSDIGLVGLQLLDGNGRIQHGGVILGLGGFADHLFQGMAPGTMTMFGHTGWYRNLLSVTGACVAVRREVFRTIGGFDERFILCGSDVALGLDLVEAGYRNICSPYGGVRHLESATRGTDIPRQDFFTSYWRYNTWLFGGDPYFSPNLSLYSREPRLRNPFDPPILKRVSAVLGRELRVFRQKSDASEAAGLAAVSRADDVDVAAVRSLHERNQGHIDVRTINWYIPEIDSPFYGGINTAFRMADYLARRHGVQNRFVVWAKPAEEFMRSALAAAFPTLADSEIVFFDAVDSGAAEQIPPADVAIATLWLTAYAVLHARNVRRKFYLVQDFEPMFYPAGTLYAVAEETYRFGLYGLCNTDNLRRMYVEEYGGKAMAFTPAVDPAVFHAVGRTWRSEDDPVTVFVYARPGHWRNCWEVASLALRELKNRLGDRVRIVTAGSWAIDPAAADSMQQLGLLSYKGTGNLYRTCDVGLALTVSKHPSYLPLELMACGVPVVAFDNPWGYWILRDGENALLARRTVDGLADALERLCTDHLLREKLAQNALATIAEGYTDWDHAFRDIYRYLCDPEAGSA